MSPGARPGGAESSTRWGLVASAWSVYALYKLGRINFSVAVPRLGEEVGLDATEIGALAAGFFWVYSLSALPVGRLADRYGARLLVGLGLVGSGIMNVLFILFSDHFALALVVWSANGVFQAMGWTPLAGGLGRWVSSRSVGRVVASFGSCFVAGTALTFAVGGFIVERSGVAAVFWAGAAVLVPVGIVWWIGVRDPVSRGTVGDPEAGSIGKVVWLLPPSAAIGVAYVALIVWTPAYFVEVHAVSVGRSGLLAAALPASSILATILMGRLFRSVDAASATLRGGIVLAATSVMLFMVSRAPDLVTGFATIAVASALVGASSSLVLGVFPRITVPGRAALASGIFALAFNLGGGAGSPVLGRLVDRDAWDLVFVFLAGCVMAGALWSCGWYARDRRAGLADRSYA